MNGSRKLRVLLVAAEVSSSLYARRLLEQWQSEKLDVEAFGIGSEDMEELGFERLGKAEELAVVGVTEVLSN
ncbi:MAG: lipid-A-disaccharide synthase, partial [Bdellovibrionaceae bacterium]|nr:lipid-A-disaccharide synthase [Pseudobdellovibrionaceae bacterium]